MKAIAKPILLALLVTGAGESVAAGQCLVQAARAQIGVTLGYDGSYLPIAYPGGDVPPERGVCTDVVIRAYRKFGVDLQRLVHEDMRLAWSAYPKRWGLSRPDRNIDHRRVPNLQTFFMRHGEQLSISRDPRDYRPGDIVTWTVAARLPHIGLISERRSASGTPLVVHNIGRGAVEEDILFSYPITGHYRYMPAPVAAGCEGTAPSICITTAAGAVEVEVSIEVASTDAERRHGLMERERLAPDAGMLFRYPAERPASAGFWMYRTQIPLDIAFLDAQGKILAIRQMLPCASADAAQCPSYAAGVPHWAALEVNRGFFAAQGIRVGDHTRMSGMSGCRKSRD
jgi:uncharacterized protein